MTVSTQTVSVSISLGTRATQAANFGIPAIFCNAPYVGGRLYELSSEGLAAMVTDGFALTSRGYLLASSMNSQEPHAEQVLVFNRAALTTCVLDFTPLVTTEGAVYNFTLTYKGVSSDISYTVGAAATVNIICDALEILIDASLAGIAGAAVAPDNATATKLTFTGATPGEPVQISAFNPAFIKLLDVSTDAGIATDLAAAALDHEFYRFVIDTFSEAENNAAAVWAEANKKRFFPSSADGTNITDAAGTGIGQDLFAAGYHRTGLLHSNDMDGNSAAAWISRQSAFDPGTSGYHYKTLQGVAGDALTATHLANAKGKNINVYALNNGTPHTFYGVAASGRSLRVQDALDLLDARIGEAVLNVFLSNEYIPMSDAGFAMMEGAVRAVLTSQIIKPGGGGFIEPGTITVTVPKASAVSSANLVAGILSSLKFSCTIPNDMQKVVVQGVVSF
jgi:hypothetical protein